MARVFHRLTALAVNKQKTPGTHADGGGLYLQVTENGSKSWSFRFMLNGRAREMGLGPLHTIDLASAREKARQCRELLLDGVDPIERRSSERAKRAKASAAAMTFDQCVGAFIKAKRADWGNPKHAAQFENTLKTYASPVFGALPAAEVDTDHVMRALSEIWATKTETATRVRQRIEAVLDWAAVPGYRTGDNPARWGGHLEYLLSTPSKTKKARPMPSLPYAQMPDFLADLREQKGIGAIALEMAILTAMRSGPVRMATWDEFNLQDRVWVVPAEHMKGQKGQKKEHRIPLCDRAVAIVERMKEHKSGVLVFAGKGDKPISDMTMGKAIKSMNAKGIKWIDPKLGNAEIVPHGFRSTFRDWAAEKTTYPHEMAELALAHAIGSKVEAAYRRGDMFEKRRQMMADWQQFCETHGPAKVMSIHAKSAA